MNGQRFLAFVLLVGLILASGPSTDHTSAAPPPAAQSETSGSWRSSGPYGGHADALALSPDFANDGLALTGGYRWGYASSKSGQGLLSSDDGGQTWSRVPQGISDYRDVASLAFSPAFGQDRTAFAGTWEGLYRSRDGGTSWQRLAGGLPTGPSEISALALSPNFSSDGTLLGGSIYGGLWRSTDGGDTWDKVLAPPVTALALSPNFPTDGLAFAGQSGFYRSADGGLTWTSTNFNTPIGARITSLAVSPALASDATLFAGTSYSGTLRSTDYGDTWTLINAGLGSLSVNALALSPAYPGDPTLFAGTGNGLYRSTDGGQSWSLTSLPVGYVGAVALSPTFADDGIVLAGTHNGVYRSTDRGMTWHLTKGLAVLRAKDVAASPAYLEDGTLFAATEYGVYKSTDRGDSWTPANRGQPHHAHYEMVQVIPSPSYPQDPTLFANVHSRIRTRLDLYRSTDGGQAWQGVWSASSYLTFDISPAYAQDRSLFVGIGAGDKLRSTDGGETWEDFNGGDDDDPMLGRLAFSPDWAHDRTVFSAGYGFLLRSTDGGASWQTLSANFVPVRDVVLSPNYTQDHTLFVSYYQLEPSAAWPETGVIRSTDSGGTWELASTGLPGPYDPPAGAIAVSPNFATDRTLYVAYHVFYSGSGQQGLDRVFRSTDGGDTWAPLPLIPGEPHIHALASTADYVVHVATDSGVWHYSEKAPLEHIVVNGGFEGGFYLLEGQSIANGWAAYTVSGQPTFAGERFTVHSGQWAYKISGYAPFTAGLAQAVRVQPGGTYRVTAYYQLYPPGDGQALLGVQDGMSAMQWVGDSWPGVWRPLSQVITVTSDRLIITLQGRNGPDPNANVYFDDVSVVAVGSP